MDNSSIDSLPSPTRLEPKDIEVFNSSTILQKCKISIFSQKIAFFFKNNQKLSTKSQNIQIYISVPNCFSSNIKYSKLPLQRSLLSKKSDKNVIF